jgi:hypothetical protein
MIPANLPLDEIIDKVLSKLSYNLDNINKKQVIPVLKEFQIQNHPETVHFIINKMKEHGLIEYEEDNFFSINACITTKGFQIQQSGGWLKHLGVVTKEQEVDKEIKQLTLEQIKLTIQQTEISINQVKHWLLIMTITSFVSSLFGALLMKAADLWFGK